MIPWQEKYHVLFQESVWQGEWMQVCGRLAPKGDGHRHHLVEETHQKTEENWTIANFTVYVLGQSR